MKSTLRRLLPVSLLMLGILLIWPATAAGAASGTVILKSSEKYENIRFMVDHYRKVVIIYLADTKKEVTFDRVDSITDKDGKDITDEMLRRGTWSVGPKRKSVVETHVLPPLWQIKKKRKRSGVAQLGGAAVLVFLEFVFKDNNTQKGGNEDVRAVNMGIAMGLVGFGLWDLSLASSAERAYDTLPTIRDAAERERSGHKALRSLAAGAQAQRWLNGTISTVSSVYCFVVQPLKKNTVVCEGGQCEWETENSPANAVFGAIFGALALYYFGVESTEQKALQRYLNEVKESEGPKLSLGVSPYGNGLRIAAVVSF